MSEGETGAAPTEPPEQGEIEEGREDNGEGLDAVDQGGSVEEALAGAPLQTDFLTVLSHEIRTPISGIMGLAQLLIESEMPTDQQDKLRTIESSARSLLELINQILDHAKIEARRIRLDVRAFDLRSFLHKVIDLFGGRFEEKEIGLSLQIGAEVQDTFQGDEGRLRQVLINVIGNAVKFTHEGKVCLDVAKEGGRSSEDRSGTLKEQLHFKVSDSGIGIQEEDMDRIFEPFSQGGKETSRQFGGTGLGLSISKRLVELMGGRIWVESRVGVGSIFHFTVEIPQEIRSQDGPDRAASREKPRATWKPGTTLNVLVAEDNAVNRRLALAMLKRLGHRVTVVKNGREVLGALENGKFDVVLMDIQMPVMDGIETTRRIRNGEVAKDLQEIPILAITANATDVDRDRCAAAGMDGYVSKPIRISGLEAALLEAVEAQSPTDS